MYIVLIEVFFILRAQTITDKIFTLIREIAGENRNIKLADILEQCTSKGYKPDQVSIVLLLVSSNIVSSGDEYYEGFW